MRGLFCLGLALALASCATVGKLEAVKITPTQVVLINNTFDSLEILADAYVKLQRCGPGETSLRNVCNTKAGVTAVARDIRAGRVARDNLINFQIKHPDGLGASGLYDAFSTAIATVQGTMKVYGAAT